MSSQGKVDLRKAEAYLLLLPRLQRYTLEPAQAVMRQDCRQTRWCLECLLPTEALPQFNTWADKQQNNLICLHGPCTEH